MPKLCPVFNYKVDKVLSHAKYNFQYRIKYQILLVYLSAME